MTKTPLKTERNRTLKVAIIEAGKTQREVAARAGLRELRVSEIVTGRVIASPDERRALAKALRCAQSALFPVAQDEAVAS
jgi:transcriptional regulator with XRE-family HTH domain